MKLTDKQKEKIKAKYEALQQAQQAFNNYLQGVGDAVGLDESKQWNFDFQTFEFKEVEKDV